MKKARQMLSLLLAGTMVLSLTACGGGSSSGSAASEAKPDAAAAPAAAAEQAEEGESVEEVVIPEGRTEVLMWSAMSGTIGENLQADADEYNDSQDKYFVNIQYQGDYNDIYTKLTTTINQADLPDLAVVSTELVGTYALTEDLLCPLSNYISADDPVWADLNGNLKAVWGKNGEPLCYPFGNSFYGQFVNAEIFEEAGIDPYEALTSVEGFYNACKTLVDGGYCEFGASLDSWGGFVWYALSAAGIQYLDNNNGRDGIPTKALLDTPEVRDALKEYFTYFRKMEQEKLIVPYGSAWGDECMPAFTSKRCAICTGSIAAFNRIEKAMEETGPFKMAWVPWCSAINLGHAPEGYAASGSGLCIVNSGDEDAMAGAAEFIAFCGNIDCQLRMCTNCGYLPLNEEGFESAEYQEFIETRFPAAAKAFELQQNAAVDALHANPLNPVNPACQSASAEAWSAVMADPNLDIDSVIDTMQETIQEALDLYNEANG